MTLLALPILAALGLWQLDRRAQKEALLSALATAPALPPVNLNAPPAGNLDFRRGGFTCTARDLPVEWIGGEGANGAPGFVARATCPAANGAPAVRVTLGFARRAAGIGKVTLNGRIEGQVRDHGPDARPRYALISAEPFPPLVRPKPPAIADIANNHLAYAVQWFAFAGILLAIYGVFVRQWRRSG